MGTSGGQWAERPSLSSLSVNKSAHAEPPEQACQELLPLPQAPGRVAAALGAPAPTGSALGPAATAGWRPDVLLEPGRGSGEAQGAGLGQEKMLLPLGSSAHLGPEPEGRGEVGRGCGFRLQHTPQRKNK